MSSSGDRDTYVFLARYFTLVDELIAETSSIDRELEHVKERLLNLTHPQIIRQLSVNNTVALDDEPEDQLESEARQRTPKNSDCSCPEVIDLVTPSKSDDEYKSQWEKLDDICIGESVSAEDMVANG